MKNTFLLLLFICSGIVVGSLVAELTHSIDGLTWLSYGKSFGMTAPFILDLSVMQITLGLSFTLNISIILFVLLAVLIYSYTSFGKRKRR